MFEKRVLPQYLVNPLQKMVKKYPVEFEAYLKEHPEWKKSSFTGDVRLDKLGVSMLSYKGKLDIVDAVKELTEGIKTRTKKSFFSFSKREDNPVDLLREAVKQNPLGLQMVLLRKPSTWSKCGIGGDVHLDKYYELKYRGDKTLNEAILELVEELQTPVSSDELNAEKAFQPLTRKIIATFDSDQRINIGTAEEPVLVTLAYDWYYYENGVYVNLVEGYSSPRFNGKDTCCISWREMYGYVRSLPLGDNDGIVFIRRGR